jgi:DNA polymerase III delta subunit
MIYLFYGTDVEKVRRKAFEWVTAARTKEPNLAYARLSSDELTASSLEDATLSGGLFIKRLLVVIDDPFQKEDSGVLIEEHINALADSDNAIIVLAPKLTAAKAKKIIAKAKVEYKYDERLVPSESRGFNSNLVNALATKNRGKLWLEINRALIEGDEPQQIHGLLHWKARDMMEKGSRIWNQQESRQLSLALIELLQNSRRGGLELSESLEKFALSI